MQSTLDVEFLAQTLSSYTTSTVTELQGKIYAVLDEKTDNEARVALQGELTGMRGKLIAPAKELVSAPASRERLRLTPAADFSTLS